jgi:hypothetical protein
MTRFAFATALLLAGTSLASAIDIDVDIASFVQAKGFTQADANGLEQDLSPLWFDVDSVSPGGQVGPLEKAVIMATAAIGSTRTRTAVSYGELILEEDGAPMAVSFIEVRHYNLGPTLHAETVAAYGAENTADIEEFGTGPHMAWRFVFQPMMGNTAILLDASSRIISDKQASRDDCNGRPCLDVGAVMPGEWEAIEGTLPTWPELYHNTDGELTTPAHAIAQLAVLGYWANSESGYYQWTGGEHPEAIADTTPYRFITIDRNLGQEAVIDTIWRETALNDDALSAISFRHVDVAGQVHLMRASEAH